MSGASLPGSSKAVADLPRLDENTPAAPDEERGLRRLRLEERLRAAFPDLIVVRATGIYGPGRCLALRFAEGDFRRAASGNKIVSRIHVHDLCRVILALALHAAPPVLVNAVDRTPTGNAELFAWLEERLRITIPGDWRETALTGRAIASLYMEELLGGRYRFESYREGFEDALEPISKMI